MGQYISSHGRRGKSYDRFRVKDHVEGILWWSPYLLNLYAEYIMRNAMLDETQAAIRITGGNISNLRYADDTTLRAGSKELKSLSMRVKEERQKVGLKLNIWLPTLGT